MGRLTCRGQTPTLSLWLSTHASFPCPYFALSINTLASKYFIRTHAKLGCPQPPAACLYTKHGNNGGDIKHKQQQWPWRTALAWFLGSISSSRGQSGVKTLVCPGLPWQHTALGQKLPRLNASKWRHMSQLGLCLIALKALFIFYFLEPQLSYTWVNTSGFTPMACREEPTLGMCRPRTTTNMNCTHTSSWWFMIRIVMCWVWPNVDSRSNTWTWKMSAHRRRPEISSVHPGGKEKDISTWLTSQLSAVCKVRRGLAFLSTLLINCFSNRVKAAHWTPTQARPRFRGLQPLGGPGKPVKMTVIATETSFLGHDIQMTCWSFV